MRKRFLKMTKSDFIKLCNILLTSRYGLCLQELYLSENKVTQYERFHPFYPPSTGSFTISTSLKKQGNKTNKKRRVKTNQPDSNSVKRAKKSHGMKTAMFTKHLVIRKCILYTRTTDESLGTRVNTECFAVHKISSVKIIALKPAFR